jgi:predicted Zn finger-like uncharacterized protein
MVITIQCPTCTASFPVDTDKIPEAGVSARCSDCGGIFRVERPPEPVVEPVEASLGVTERVEAATPALEAPEEAVPEVEPSVVDEVGPVPAGEEGGTAFEPETTEEIELPYIEMPDVTAPVEEEPEAGLPEALEPVAEASSWDSLLEAVPVEDEPEESEPVAEASSWDSLLEAVPIEDEPVRGGSVWDTAVELETDLPEVELPDVGLPEVEPPEVEPISEVDVTVPEAPSEELPQADEVPVDVYIPAPGEGGVEMPDIEDQHEDESDDVDDWVVVMEGEYDLGGLVIEPVGTVEQEVAEASRDESIAADDLGSDVAGLVTPVEAPADRIELEPPFGSGLDMNIPDAPAVPEPPVEVIPEPPVEVIPEPPVEVIPEPPMEVTAESTGKPVGGFTFGKRDPDDKARRLARVLVSDMIMYNPERHEQALTGGTLKEDFEEEITKSWKEYVEQVGGEMAAGTTYWADALNEVLAKGQQIF